MTPASPVLPTSYDWTECMDDIAVVGIGNPFRGDDGAGWAVIELLEGKLPHETALVKQRGDMAQLLDIFSSHPIVYIVDASLGDGPVGSWQRIDALQQPLLIEDLHTSTHGFGVAQAIALAHTLQQLPSRLIIYAIAANRYHMDNALSHAVAQAVPAVALAIIEEVTTCMKKASQIA